MRLYVEFFCVLCRHQEGRGMNLTYECAVNLPGQDDLPRVLGMYPLPVGDYRGIDELADWFRKEAA